MMDRLFGMGLIALSAASFGAAPIFARLAYAEGADPVTVLFLRFFLAALVMIVFMAVAGRSFPRGKNLITLSLMGGLGYVAVSFCYFTALTMASASLVAVLLYLYPSFVAFLSAVFLKTSLTNTKILALFCSLAGTILVVGVNGEAKMLGILLAVTAPIIYSIYIVIGSRVTVKEGALPSASVVIVAAGLVYGIIVTIKGAALPQSGLGWGSVIGIVLVSTNLAIAAFFGGLKRVDPAKASVISTLEPAVTFLLAFWVLGETLTWSKVVGALMIIASILLLTRREHEKRGVEHSIQNH
jgi:drug/metabolite transporter (DMT)-like permease